MGRAVPRSTAATFYQVEQRISMMIDQRIAAMLPVLQFQSQVPRQFCGEPPTPVGGSPRAPYEAIERERVKLPKRSTKGRCDDALDPQKVRFVPSVF